VRFQGCPGPPFKTICPPHSAATAMLGGKPEDQNETRVALVQLVTAETQWRRVLALGPTEVFAPGSRRRRNQQPARSTSLGLFGLLHREQPSRPSGSVAWKGMHLGGALAEIVIRQSLPIWGCPCD